MARFPSAALLEAGLLKTRCGEPLIYTCPECGGLRNRDDSACEACFNTDAPRLKCATCKLHLPAESAGGDRACLSRQAYDADPNGAPAFSRSGERLWGLKASGVAAVEVIRDADLRRRLASGELPGTVLVSGDAGHSFKAAEDLPDLPKLKGRGGAGQGKSRVKERSPAPMPAPVPLSPPPAPRPVPSPAPTPAPEPVPAPVPASISFKVFATIASTALVLILFYSRLPKVEPELVVVPPGTFMMGSLSSEDGHYADEGPVRYVRIGYTFEVGRHEVTRREFGRFVAATGYRTEAERDVGAQGCRTWSGSKWEYTAGRYWRSPGFEQGEDHPVVCVSWNDAQAYLKWMNERVSGRGYRLLSEAEWEYVARAGRGSTRYPWGNDEGSEEQCAWANGVDAAARERIEGLGAWKVANCSDGHAYTAPVGSFPANTFGLHDLQGNVREWVQDVWHDNYAGAPSDGSAWMTGGDQSPRVLRGGSWAHAPRNLRSANRNGNTPDSRSNFTGFRIARTLDVHEGKRSQADRDQVTAQPEGQALLKGATSGAQALLEVPALTARVIDQTATLDAAQRKRSPVGVLP